MTNGFILMLSHLRFALGLSLALAAHCAGAACSDTAARVTAQREGNVIRVCVENSELGEVTVTFDFSPVNLKGSVSFPHTATFQPGKTEAFTLAPIRPDPPWHFSTRTILNSAVA